jgi:integrase
LKVLRADFVGRNLSRKYVNDQMSRVRRIFKWGVEEELILPGVIHALQAVPGLARGRSNARETESILPVSDEIIAAVEPHLSRQVWAMIQLQLYTGCRAGEIVRLRPIDLNMTGHVWFFTLDDHKNTHRGHSRTIYVGPHAQTVVQPFLADRSLEQFLFSPRDAENERHARAQSHRRPDQQANARKTARLVGDRYTVGSYRRAVQRACKIAGVSSWSPSQLRHNAATMVRKQFGLDGAQVMLGHTHADVTQIYAQVNQAKGVEIAATIG